MKLIIPFTLPGLNEYISAERTHRQKAANLKRDSQQAVALVLRRQIKRQLKEPVAMHYTWFERNQRRDKDNISSFGRKVIQDALVQIKALKNDGWANIDRFTDNFEVDKKLPRVEIEIEEAEGQP